jgi:hypothetical protein
MLHNQKADRTFTESKPKDNHTQYWATFTFVGKETKTITKLFKNTNIKIAYKTSNSLQKLLTPRPDTSKKDNFQKSGMYRLTCPDCKQTYTGQTRKNFKKRYKEHFQSYKYGSQNSKFAQHLLDNKHSFGSMHDIMTPLCFNKKGIHLNTLEKFHIFEEVQRNNHINDKCTIIENKIKQRALWLTTPCHPLISSSAPPPPPAIHFAIITHDVYKSVGI